MNFTNKILSHRFFAPAVTAVITFCVYLPALQNRFVWDDAEYVTDNPFIRSFDPAFFKQAFLGFFASNWHPLAWISHALDYAVWKFNPVGHHLTNNIIHAANAFLVVILTIRLIQAAARDAKSHATVIAAVLTGLLFGLHPLHVESVAWVSERKDLLCAFFYLISVLSYTVFAQASVSGRWFLNRHYIFALASFALALMSKPMAVSLPVVLLLLDWWPFGRISSIKSLANAITEKVPFIGVTVLSALLTLRAQQDSTVSLDAVPLTTRALVAAKSFTLYLWKMIWPLNLLPLYPYPSHVSPLSFEYLFPVIIIAVLIAACVALLKRQKIWTVAFAYYAVTLLPVLGIVQAGYQSMADRYTYLPSLGPFLIIGLSTAWMWSRASASRQRGAARALLCGVAAVLICMSILTYRQIGIWKNGITLWSHVIESDPRTSFIAYLNRGAAYKNDKQFEKAVADFNTTIALKPTHYMAYYYRGDIFQDEGRLDQAIADYNTAITLNSFFDEEYLSRGRAYLRIDRVDKAIADFEKARDLNPSSGEAYNGLGLAYSKTGSYDKAIDFFSRSLALNSNQAKTFYNRGNMYWMIERYDKALDDYTSAIAVKADYAKAHRALGILLVKTNNRTLAMSELQKACILNDETGCQALRDLEGSLKQQ